MSQQQDRSDNREQGTGSQQNEGRSFAEWTTLAISITILVVIVGLITYLYIRGTQEEPRIVAEAKFDELRSEESGYYLPVEVKNEGDRTVENVVIEAELDSGSGQPQTAEISVTFLAGGEQVLGAVIFDEDPTQGDLTVRATSYKLP